MKRLILAIILAMVAVSGPALAEDATCGATFVDTAGVVTDQGKAQIERSVRALEDMSAVVRVRVVSNMGGSSNLDQYEANVLRNCQSWQDPQGGRRSNMITLFVAMEERETGIYVGDLYKTAIKDSWTDILAKDIVPHLRDGDVGAALSSGLDSVKDSIQAAKAARTAPPTQTVVVQQPSEPMDLSGLLSVLRWLISIVCVVIGGWLIYIAISSYRTRRAQARAAKANAINAKARCTTAINTIPDDFPILGARINKLSSVVAPATIIVWRDALTHIKQKLEGISATFDTVRTDPDQDKLSVEEYRSMEEGYKRFADDFETVRSLVTALKSTLDQAEEDLAALPGELQAAGESFQACEQRINAIRAQGFTLVAVLEAFGEAKALLEKAADEGVKLNPTSAIKHCRQAVSDANAAAQTAEDAPETKRRLTAMLSEVNNSLPKAATEIDTGKATFAALVQHYDDSCFHSVNGNGTEAELRYERAVELLKKATTLLEQQDWVTAEAFIQQAKATIEEITSLMRSIAKASANLDAIKQHLPGDIEAIKADISRANAYLDTHDEDTDDNLSNLLADVGGRVAEIERQFGSDKPHYLHLADAVRKADEDADAVFARARSEVEAAERLRQQAQSALRSAEASVSTAREYVEDHRSDVESQAKSLVNQAAETLASAREYQRRGNPTKVIEMAMRARQTADQAYASAKSDVSDAEGARELQRAQARSSATSYGAGSLGRSTGSTWGGGTTGGSRSFGGAGGTTGGSTKW